MLSPLFDRVGRVKMITGTYVLSGVLLGVTGFVLGDLTATTLTIMGAIVFFFASAGASSAYLTASEIFPMETRALCISFFYAIGTAAGGITGPLLFGKLIDDASADKDITGIAVGYFIGAVLMIGGGLVEAVLGIKAEGRSLEDIATPLTAEDTEDGGRADVEAARLRLAVLPLGVLPTSSAKCLVESVVEQTATPSIFCGGVCRATDLADARVSLSPPTIPRPAP